jgi:hypothetical protein
VAVLDCPGDLVNEASCEPAPAGVAVELTPADSDEDNLALETDDDGVATGQVDPGAYDLEVDGGVCFATRTPSTTASSPSRRPRRGHRLPHLLLSHLFTPFSL